MRFDPGHLETLVAIAEEGSFDAAARRLRLTPSAVSQRIRALERTAGAVLVRRTAPAVVTRAGEPLLRLGRQLRLLAAEAEKAMDRTEALDLPVAVNADSLATWFRPVLGVVAQRAGQVLRLHVEDQAHSHRLLRRGEVLAAVTDEPEPVQGCTAVRLGAQRYIPAAAPELLRVHRRQGAIDWSTLPMVVFNEADRLQDRVLKERGARRPPVVHRVPTTADFLAAVQAGLGWGMLPQEQFGPARRAGGVEQMPDTGHIDVPLHWQRWRLQSPALDALSDDVQRAAARLER